MRRQLCSLLSLLLLLLTGCSVMTPTLRVAEVVAVPLPNAVFERDLWGTATPLTIELQRGSGPTRQILPAQLRAIHDGRALSILLVWLDATQSLERQAWVWSPERDDYHLMQFEIDQASLFWPMSPNPSFRFFDGRPAVYDAWHWIAGWTDRSGYANDGLMTTRPCDDASSVTGEVFSMAGGRGMVEIQWPDDAGESGTFATPKPAYQQRHQMPGALTRQATGSVADVQARSIYSRFPRGRESNWFINRGKRSRGTWFGEAAFDEQGYWLVEFYRLFKTPDAQHDYLFLTPGPHRFAVMIGDRETGMNQYQSDPIQLVFEGDRAPGAQGATP